MTQRHHGVVNDRKCAVCKTALAASSHPQTLYCSKSCKGYAYRLKNKDKIGARTKAWYRANHERALAYAAQYREQHREHLKAQNRAAYRDNPIQWANARDRRRARERAGNTAVITMRDRERLLMHHRGGCAYCGSKLQIEWDHVIPVSRGGDRTVGNMLPACFRCNRDKSALFIMEWKLKKRRRQERALASE